MKIQKVTYYDHELEWRFEPIEFANFTLLVGASGVGKTQILESINKLQKIANGESLNGVEWDTIFSVDNSIYQWQGEFEAKKVSSLIKDDESEKNSHFRILREKLSKEGKLIIERRNSEIIFKGDKLPKLSPFQSIVDIFSEEEDITPVKNGFKKIIYSNPLRENSIDVIMYPKIYSSLSSKPSSLEEIREMNLPIQLKLALTYKYVPWVFNKIKENFINIFFQVEDIKMDPDENDDHLFIMLAEYPFIQIKEKGVNHWIKQRQISSGMLKTLLHISEIYLYPEESIILIDEFENSLGVNCIDVVIDLLLENRNTQFIITSHHPYIINNIAMEYWKIVTRKGGVVTARDAKDFNLGRSRHEAFMQLINLDAYKEGISIS
ncbi:MAG: AAA family ATPase [Scytonema sp. PMC 1070.18]|nr:AAA family ATPase [Scytonema sp. PMC 1070.18]